MQLHFDNFGKRFCSYVIDMLILTITFAVLGVINRYMNFVSPFVQTAIFYSITILYFSIMESGKHQATLGKMVLGLTVWDANKEDKISFPRAIIRNIARIINMPIFCLGYLIIIFTKKQQGLHDFIARTRVVEAESIWDRED